MKNPDGTKYDDIFGVHLQDFYDNGELVAWMWVGVSMFQKAIPKINKMRGLRLRKENIQIGSEDVLQRFFKEDRGNNYFVGEVFAIDKNLIPNSQRDYFNENSSRVSFERFLGKYLREELHKVYYDGSKINSAYKKIDSFRTKEAQFLEKDEANIFINEDHRENELLEVHEAGKKAEEAIRLIENLKERAGGLTKSVISRIEKERIQTSLNGVTSESDHDENSKPRKVRHRTEKLSKFSRAERKLITRIFSIINAVVDTETAETIILKIEEELK